MYVDVGNSLVTRFKFGYIKNVRRKQKPFFTKFGENFHSIESLQSLLLDFKMRKEELHFFKVFFLVYREMYIKAMALNSRITS